MKGMHGVNKEIFFFKLDDSSRRGNNQKTVKKKFRTCKKVLESEAAKLR